MTYLKQFSAKILKRRRTLFSGVNRYQSLLSLVGPYAGMNITGVTGISDAQKMTLKQLGALAF